MSWMSDRARLRISHSNENLENLNIIDKCYWIFTEKDLKLERNQCRKCVYIRYPKLKINRYCATSYSPYLVLVCSDP